MLFVVQELRHSSGRPVWMTLPGVLQGGSPYEVGRIEPGEAGAEWEWGLARCAPPPGPPQLHALGQHM